MTVQDSETRTNRSQLSAGSKVTGDLKFPGYVELHGEVDGSVRAGSIMVEQSSEAKGDLIAEQVQIRGNFEGKVSGGIVTLHSSAKVKGSVVYETLTIESGAQVDITCKPGRKS